MFRFPLYLMFASFLLPRPKTNANSTPSSDILTHPMVNITLPTPFSVIFSFGHQYQRQLLLFVLLQLLQKSPGLHFACASIIATVNTAMCSMQHATWNMHVKEKYGTLNTNMIIYLKDFPTLHMIPTDVFYTRFSFEVP